MSVFERISELLRDAQESATMERMSVGWPHERVKLIVNGQPTTAPLVTVDDFIRERTAIYRDTWIVPRIGEARELLDRQTALVNRLERLHKSLEEKGDLEAIVHLMSAGRSAA